MHVDPKSRVISKAYPYVAGRVLTDSQEDLQEALRRLALTPEGRVRWDRLESLLDEAQSSADYDVAAALDVLTDYLISDDGNRLLDDLSVQIVDAADLLGTDALKYLFDAVRALSIRDEVAAVKAFRAIQELIVSQQGGPDILREKVGKDLKGVLPELTPSMQRFSKILSLLSVQSSRPDPTKFLPVARKLIQEPRVQQVSSEIMARIGERMLSRGLRAVFGLPPPAFGRATAVSTVTEQDMK